MSERNEFDKTYLSCKCMNFSKRHGGWLQWKLSLFYSGMLIITGKISTRSLEETGKFI